MSWIHQDDFIRAIEFLIARHDLDGCINIASPNPLPHRDFMRLLREAAGIRFGPRVPEWALRFGSMLLGTEAELILKSRRVVPGRLLKAGFEFRFPQWREAARDLLTAIDSAKAAPSLRPSIET
jgi:NAD dependent epimerase/dehydratase family enzyme